MVFEGVQTKVSKHFTQQPKHFTEDSYDVYLIPEGIEDYSYTKDRKEIKGLQYKVKLEFPQKKK